MKFAVGILLLVSLLKISVATRVFLKHEIAKNQKYRLNREPPLDKDSIFAADEVVETRWIEQRLNHFDSQDERRWNMRYMENSHYLQPGSPIFIYVGEFSEFSANCFECN